MNTLLRSFFFLILLGMLGCAPAADDTPPPFQPVDDAPAQVEEVAPEVSAAEVLEEIEQAEPDRPSFDQIPTYVAEEMSHLFSILVVQDGELIFEHYPTGQDPEAQNVVWSITKSFTSALIGIAMDEGLIDNLDQTVGDFLSAQIPVDADPRLNEVTIRQLLTMTSGVFCSNDRCHDSSLDQVLQRNMLDNPGARFVYDTSSTHLLSAILAEVTGVSPYEYAQEKLFDPLDFGELGWDVDAQGNYFGGKGLNLRPRDMAKFGQLFLDEGVWEGEQFISAEYVAESTSQQETGIPADSDYGYLWWIPRDQAGDSYAAVGFGGQIISVVPELEAVIVVTSRFDLRHADNGEFIRDQIIPILEEMESQ